MPDDSDIDKELQRQNVGLDSMIANIIRLELDGASLIRDKVFPGIKEIKEEINENTGNKILPNYDEYTVDNKVEHTLYENFTHIRPFGFRIDGEELIEVKTWQEVFLKTCELLLYKDEKKFCNLRINLV